MNTRISQFALIIAILTAVLTVMYFATRPPAPTAEAPDTKSQATPDPNRARPSFAAEFDPEDPEAEFLEFSLPEFEPLPPEQQELFLDAYNAILNQDPGALRALLATTPDAAQWASNGTTLLLHAIRERNEPALRVLIEAGADLNYSDGMGASPLIDAIAYAFQEAVPILLDAGAGIESPLGVLGQTPLMIAAEFGDIPSMQLLLDAGADIDARIEKMQGETALFCAVNQSQPGSIRFLLDAGADAAISNNVTGLNPEQTAVDMYNDDLYEDKAPILEVIQAFEAEPNLAPD